jgi:membrane associated rhomboid family serine protease
VLWIVQIINNADLYRLSIDYSIRPRIASDLPYIFTAPFLHWSWGHIEGNSIPFLVLGFLAAYRSIPRFIVVTAVVLLTSGLALWLSASTSSESVGASGVIFGWFGYVIVRGFFTRSKMDIVIGILVMLNYLPTFFSLMFPAPNLAYQGHIGGLVGGVFCAWAFRIRPVPATPAVSTSPTDVLRSSPVPSSPLLHVEAELAALKTQISNERRTSQ